MIVTQTLIKGQPLTEAQKKEIEEARNSPIVYDEDCPQMTPEMEEKWKKAVIERNQRIKEVNL